MGDERIMYRHFHCFDSANIRKDDGGWYLGNVAAIIVDCLSAEGVEGKVWMDEAGVVDLVRMWLSECCNEPARCRYMGVCPSNGGIDDTLELRIVRLKEDGA
jgi:hypothetical protein